MSAPRSTPGLSDADALLAPTDWFRRALRQSTRPPSGTGAQASIFGVLGSLAAAEEGLEVNVLGLTFGLDPSDLALKLPLVGSIGFDAWDTPNSQ